jgi:hypothetical protein
MTSYLDPLIFDESAIDPEIMLFNEELEKIQAKVPPVHTRPPQQVREVRESGQTMWGEVKILDLDPLLDDTIFMYGRWIASGNQADLEIFPGGTHVLERLPTKLAEKANNRIYDFIHEILEENH